MNMLKKIITIFVLFLTIAQLHRNNENLTSIDTINNNNVVNVSVLFSDYKIRIWEIVAEELKKVEQENIGTIHFTFYDGGGNENTQENQLSDILGKKKADILIYNIIDATQTKNVLDKIKQFNIPVIFANNGDLDAIKSYTKAYLAGLDPREVGTMMGDIIVDAWKKNKSRIDKNKNNTLEYIILQGTPNNQYSSITSKYSILTINNNKIKTKELANKYCNWDEHISKVTIEQIFLGFGNSIEAIITVDDDMAVGAVKALQEYGYNMGNSQNNIIVTGVAGTPDALNLINKGYMTGTIPLGSYKQAKYYYTFVMNLINNMNVIAGTDCILDPTGKRITIPSFKAIVNLD